GRASLGLIKFKIFNGLLAGDNPWPEIGRSAADPFASVSDVANEYKNGSDPRPQDETSSLKFLRMNSGMTPCLAHSVASSDSDICARTPVLTRAAAAPNRC